jgi:hypothetical protein
VAGPGGEQELIRFILFITFSEFGWNGARGLIAFPQHDCVPGNLIAFPTVVAIHCIISPNHCGDHCSGALEFAFDRFEVSCAPGGRGVPSVCNGVNQDFLHPSLGSGTRKSDEMFLMTVDTAVRN